jgi:hypothetical protein
MSEILQPLNLPAYPFKLRPVDKGHEIFDEVRGKWLLCTPEEWVRQHFVMFLLRNFEYSKGLLAIEIGLTVNGQKKRADIVVYNSNRSPVMIVECKSTKIKLGTSTFEQAASYNMALKVPFLVITNGKDHYCAQIDHASMSWKFVDHIPTWDEIQNY